MDVRAQCAAMVFSFQLAESFLATGQAERVLLVGSECHAGFMPWRDWDALDGKPGAKVTPEDFERATAHRGYAVIFGDGAGALVLDRKGERGQGLLSVDLHSDGRYTDELLLPAGFHRRPFLDQRTLAEDEQLPRMNGREVFKHAVSKLPRAVRKACEKAGVELADIDWFVAHQANDRINQLVRERLGVPEAKVPSNIAHYGNTSGATIPILVDEMRRDGRLQDGQLVCLLALGAGIHWGAAILRI